MAERAAGEIVEFTGNGWVGVEIFATPRLSVHGTVYVLHLGGKRRIARDVSWDRATARLPDARAFAAAICAAADWAEEAAEAARGNYAE